LGSISLGMPAASVELALGPPSSRSGPAIFEAGVPHTTAWWRGLDLAVGFVEPVAAPHRPEVESVEAGPASMARTSCGVGIDASAAELARAYGDHLIAELDGDPWRPDPRAPPPGVLLARLDEDLVLFTLEAGRVVKIELASAGILAGIR
jgi:hypothetical protein